MTDGHREPRKAKGGAHGPGGGVSVRRTPARGPWRIPPPALISNQGPGAELARLCPPFPPAEMRLHGVRERAGGTWRAATEHAGPGSPRARDPGSDREQDLGVDGVSSPCPHTFGVGAEPESRAPALESGGPGLLCRLRQAPNLSEPRLCHLQEGGAGGPFKHEVAEGRNG